MINNQQTMETSMSVLMAVAVSSNGRTDCHIADSPYIQQKQGYEAWIADKRNMKNTLWCIKHVKVNVPYPESYEDMGNAP